MRGILGGGKRSAGHMRASKTPRQIAALAKSPCRAAAMHPVLTGSIRWQRKDILATLTSWRQPTAQKRWLMHGASWGPMAAHGCSSSSFGPRNSYSAPSICCQGDGEFHLLLSTRCPPGGGVMPHQNEVGAARLHCRVGQRGAPLHLGRRPARGEEAQRQASTFFTNGFVGRARLWLRSERCWACFYTSAAAQG